MTVPQPLTYVDAPCKSVLNRVEGMPFPQAWRTLEPGTPPPA